MTKEEIIERQKESSSKRLKRAMGDRSVTCIPFNYTKELFKHIENLHIGITEVVEYVRKKEKDEENRNNRDKKKKRGKLVSKS